MNIFQHASGLEEFVHFWESPSKRNVSLKEIQGVEKIMGIERLDAHE